MKMKNGSHFEMAGLDLSEYCHHRTQSGLSQDNTLGEFNICKDDTKFALSITRQQHLGSGVP
mgnify:CR=1 FL=1